MNENHRELRELVGPYVLGHLDAAASGRMRVHLESCPTCREEVRELGPLAGLLQGVDPASLVQPAPEPSPELAVRVRSAVALERLDAVQTADRRSVPRSAHPHRARRSFTRSAAALAVAATVLGAALGGGFVWGQTSVPEATSVPREVITLNPGGGTGIVVDEAFLVNHTWGVELRIDATGFTAGDEFTAVFRRADGSTVSGGEFLGVGAAPMLCNLQSAVLRDDLIGLALTDDSGKVVAEAAL